MLSLRFKLLIPTLLTTLLMVAGITYIAIVENHLFQKEVENERELRQLKFYNGFKELTTKLAGLTDFFGKDWRIKDNLITESKDTLLDLLVPFHQGFEFDLINIYDAQGVLIARADKPSLFGKSDEFQQKIVNFIKNPPLKPEVTLFEGQLVLLDWKILQQKTHGINAAIMVGYHLDEHHLKRIATYMDGQFLLKYGTKLTVNIEGAKNQDTIEFPIQLDNLIHAELPFTIVLLEPRSSAREKELWKQLFSLILVLSIISMIVIVVSHYLTTSTANKLQRARRIAEEIAQSLAHAKTIAESANRAKSAFLASMSHELRTPLNGILGYTQILNRDRELNHKQKEGIGVIQRSGEYLLTLINDILDLSKIESGRVELQVTPINLHAFMQSIVEIFKVRVQQKGIAFVYQTLSPLPDGLIADEKRLRQIIINLLGNAVKFTEQGTVTLKIGYLNGQLRIEVADTGIGIAAADINKIFLPFEQSGEVLHKVEGTGLGLAITKNLVEMMGGTLQVHSVLGVGSTFWTELELTTTTLSTNQKIEKPHIIGYQVIADSTLSNPLNRYKILVVDDKSENRLFLTHFLSTLGFEVQEAKDGRQAITQVKNWLPDLVFMDLMMPVFSGFEATRELRKEFTQLPIIAVSASAFNSDFEEALTAGFDDFIPKPVNINQMLDCLQKYLALNWIYSHVEQVNTTIPAQYATENLAVKLPSNDSTKLLHLARQGDISGILELVDHLTHEKPSLLPLLQHIKQLAKNFEEEAICDLLEQKYQRETHSFS